MNKKILTSLSIVALFSIYVSTGTTVMTVKAYPPKTEFHIVLGNCQIISQDYTILNNIITIKTVQEYDITGSIDGSMVSSGTVIFTLQPDIAIVSGSFVITTNDGNTISGTSFAMIRGFSQGPWYFEIVQYTFVGHGFMNIKGTISILSQTEIGMDGYSW